ncbi:protein zer-1 homolog isoform 1-T1 [Clarias gariepinus]
MAAQLLDDTESLMSLCTVFCLKNLKRTICYTSKRNKLRLRPDIFLPSEICNKLVNVYTELVHTDSEFEPLEGFFQLFSDPNSTRLSRLHLKEGVVRDCDLEAFRKQDLMELHLTRCNHLRVRSLSTLRNFRHSLVSLSLFGCSKIFYSKKTDFLFQGFDRLCMLNFGSLHLPKKIDLEVLLKPLDNLRALDLSSMSLPRPAFLAQWREQLTSLVLYNVYLNEELITTVLCMRRLRHLDISCEIHHHSVFQLTREILTNIIQILGNLVSLDISGHIMLDNCIVPSIKEAVGPPSIEPCKSSIFPFQGLKRPLQFLGLYNTPLCDVTHIPAFKVTGSKNEEQVLNAIEAYTEHRPELAHTAIRQLYNFVLIQQCNNLGRALQLVTAALKCHKYNKRIQKTGSEALGYMIGSESWRFQSVKIRRQAIEVIVNGLEKYQEFIVTRTSCQTLCKFKIPGELDFQYHRISLLLEKIMESLINSEMLSLIWYTYKAIFLKETNNDHEDAVSIMGFIKAMLNLIQKKLHDTLNYGVILYSWMELSEITAGKPNFCQMFLKCSGMKVFLDCLKAFPSSELLHCNMLGLLWNVAEVKELRPQLLTKQVITAVSNLLCKKTNGIKVSYNACEFLSHIMLDGPEVWTVENPNRDMVIEKMVGAIQSWDVTSYQIIEYRSFESILPLLSQSISPVSQHWAMWTLYRLVFIDPKIYSELLVKEGGIALLQRVLQLESSHQDTKTMARKVMEKCGIFKEDPMDTSN